MRKTRGFKIEYTITRNMVNTNVYRSNVVLFIYEFILYSFSYCTYTGGVLCNINLQHNKRERVFIFRGTHGYNLSISM